MLFSVIGAALITVAVCLLVKKTNPEFSMATSLISGILIFSLIIINFTQVMDFINNVAGSYGLNSQYISIVLKALGICYLTQLAADCCKDSGFSAIAGKVELGGKVAVIILSLPLFENILNFAKELVSLGG